MIFERTIDSEYHLWFAWRPVRLCGPDEWNRSKITGGWPRWVWLRWVWRMRVRPDNYYALGE